MFDGPIDALVREFIPNSKTLKSSGGEKAWQLPFESISSFADFFERLEEECEASSLNPNSNLYHKG